MNKLSFDLKFLWHFHLNRFYQDIKLMGIKQALNNFNRRNESWDEFKSRSLKQGFWECRCGEKLSSERAFKWHQTHQMNLEFPKEKGIEA